LEEPEDEWTFDQLLADISQSMMEEDVRRAMLHKSQSRNSSTLSFSLDHQHTELEEKTNTRDGRRRRNRD